MWSMWLDLLVFCDCGFQSVCPLMEKGKRFMEASWWERLIDGETGSCSDGRGCALKLKKVGKTTRPFRYDLNQIPYDYTVEVWNRFKGLDLSHSQFPVLFCWLYGASPSLAAKNIINLILVLTIWWCPCVESSLVLLEEGVCYDQCVLLAKFY